MNVLGIDAGGTKTSLVFINKEDLRNDSFKNYQERTYGPSNYVYVGNKGIKRLIKGALRDFDITTPQNTYVIAGFAGAGFDERQSEIRKVFEEMGFDRKKVYITSDADLLLLSIGNNGIVLIAGTGSICLGRRIRRSDGTLIEYRAGGYGFRSFSEPGGYQLGMKAIDAALKIEDCREQESSILYQRVKDYFKIRNLSKLTPLLYPTRDDRGEVQEKIAGLAKVVLNTAYEGDKVALTFAKETLNGLADEIRAVFRRLGFEESIVALHGGLFADPRGEKLLIKPLMRHPFLKGLNLKFETLGIRTGDKNPLIEAVKYWISREVL